MCKTVMVVEDDSSTRTVLAQILSMIGYDVVTAENGRDALERLAAGCHPCLILLDMMMPVMDGYEFLQKRRSVGQAAEVPVVVSSAAAVTRAIDVEGFLPKPVDLRRLEQEVARFCDRNGQSRLQTV